MTPEYSSQKDKILELEKRRKIYNLVKKYVGCHFRDLERKSKLPASSIKYHLNYLARHELITEEKEGNNLRYFPKEFNTDNKVLLSLLRQESIRKILIFLLDNENNSHEDIVRFVGLSPSTVSWHLKKLENKKIVTSIKNGRATNYRLLIDKKDVMNLLVTYQESFLDSLVNKVVEMWDVN
ncbi:MAG: winged helix-turn-helix transcriptional regulator [Patescibacteria group bacterium]